MSSLVFVFVFGGALAGMAVRRVKPDERFTPDAKDSIRLAIGLVVTGSNFYDHVQLLVPKSEAQASVKAQFPAATLNLRKTYWLLFLQSEQTSTTIPVLSAVTAWLVVIFFSFGIFAPRIPNVILTFVICAMSVSVAIFIILSMNSPFSGALRISPAAVRDVRKTVSFVGKAIRLNPIDQT
jgi:hypothetical protein